MGLFGFGKKKKSAENIEDENKEENKIDSSAEDSEKSADSDAESQNDAERTVQRGPWDINDENVIEFEDTHLQLGSIYLPFMKDIKIFVKKEKDVEFLSGITISFRTSSLEIEPFAAPRSSGLWDKHRENLIASNPGAEETEGTFGKEVILPVSIEGGKTLKTRIAAVDGPRWMLRGIFTGPAASENGEEKEALEEFFSRIVVDRGSVPIAPESLLPMTAPKTPEDRKKERGETDDLQKPDGPLTPAEQVESETVLRRGPVFSEMR